MTEVRILADFSVYAGSFDGIGDRLFLAGAIESVPDEAAQNFIAKGLAEEVQG